MAEALGVVASGIAVAQLAGGAIKACLKLKELWDQIEGSQEIIQDLIEQIEVFGPALWDAEQTFSNPGMPACVWNDSGAQNCIKYYRKALQNLKELVEELAAQVGSAKKLRKSVGKVKVVIKRKQLDQLEAKLRRALDMLQAAQTGYLIAQSRLQPDIIAAKVRSMISSEARITPISADERVTLVEDDVETTEKTIISSQLAPRTKTSTVVSPRTRLGPQGQPKNTREYSAAIIPPTWLSPWMHAWRLTLRQSYSGWDVNIRYYATRPIGSKSFGVAMSGDLDSLKTLMITGQARPDDECHGSRQTLLHFAVIGWGDSSLIKYLLDAGCRADQVSVSKTTPGEDYFEHKHVRWTGAEEIEAFHLLQAAGLFPSRETSNDDGSTVPNHCTCPDVIDASNFRTIQAVACPSHETAPVWSKLKRVWLFYADWQMHDSSVDVFKYMLSPEWESDREMLCREEWNVGHTMSLSLLHMMSYLLGNAYVNGVLAKPRHIQRTGDSCRGPEWHQVVDDLGCLLSEMVPFCHNLHIVSRWHLNIWSRNTHGLVTGTPLTWALSRCVFEIGWKYESLLEILQKWLSVLKQAGVDLCEYGRLENAALSKYEAEFMVQRDWKTEIFEPVDQLLRYKIGPDVGDWDVYVMEAMNDYSSDFWALVEGRPVGVDPYFVPGAWIEED